MHQKLHPHIKSNIVVSTTIKGKRYFVSKNHTPCDNGRKVIITLTADPEEAKTFFHRGLAMDFIVTIKDPHRRVFTWDTAISNRPEPKLLTMPAAREVLQKVS